MDYTIGIDLGGTKLAAALVNSAGKIIAFKKESILNLKSLPSHQGPKKICSLMTEMVLSFKTQYPHCFTKKNFKGVGLASAGPLNVETGKLIKPANFANWQIVPIKSLLSSSLKSSGLPYTVEFQNDAIAASLAEGWVGAAKKMKSFAVVTIGTGIGSGVIFNHQPVQTNGMGSEFGHSISNNFMIKNPTQDLKKFTVEGIASGTGILRRAKELGFQGHTIEDLVLSLESDKQYLVLFDDAARALAGLCYNLSIGFNLDGILFSGGLIKIKHLYFETLKVRYTQLINEFNPAFKCSLKIAKCRNHAGVIGAAYLPRLKLK